MTTETHPNHSEPAMEDKFFQARRKVLEDRIVREVLTAAGQKGRIPQLREQAEAANGSPALTLDHFAGRFPRFPVQLSLPMKDDLGHVGWTSFFGAINKSPVYTELSSHPDKPTDKNFGVVIPAEIGLMVAHDCPPFRPETINETQIFRVFGRRKERLTVTTLAALVESIPRDWCEGGPV